MVAAASLAILITAAAGKPELSLRDCLDSAVARNASLRQKDAEVRIADRKVAEVAADYFPSLDASLDFSRMNEDQYLRFGSGSSASVARMGNAERLAARLGLNQLLFDFGRTGGKVEAARSERLEAELSRAGRRSALQREVESTYLLAIFNEQADSLYRENLESNRQLVGIVKSRLSAGTATQSDVLRAEVNALNAEALGMSAARDRGKAMEDLAALLSLPPGSFGLRGTMAQAAGAGDLPEDGAERAVQKALEARNDLKALGAGKRRAESSRKATRREAWPKLYFRAETDYLAPNLEDDYYEMDDKGLKTNTWRVGINLQASLFDGGKRSAQAAQLGLQAGLLADREHDLRQRIGAETRKAWLDVRTAAELSRTSSAAETQARENLRVAKLKLESGAFRLLDYIDALNTLLLTQVSGLQRRYELSEALLSLERAMESDSGFLFTGSAIKETK